MEHVMSSLIAYAPLLLRGAGVTVCAWLASGTASLLVGACLGIMSADFLGLKAGKKAIAWYSFVTKGVPVYVQILIAYYMIPSLLGITVSPFVAASGALALCSSGYVVEIVRSGMNAIDRGQWEASFVLGYTKLQTIRCIIAPQALKIVVPALIG